MAALVSTLSLFLCNDTGVMHVAASVGTPLVAIFGPTDIAQWKPAGDKFVAVQHASRLCASVQPGEVIEKSVQLLSL